jgi:hypothetical protein
MNMRLDHGLDAQALVIGQPQVAVDVALGVHEQRLARRLASDQIGVLRQSGIVDLMKMHPQSSFAGPAQASPAPRRPSTSAGKRARSLIRVNAGAMRTIHDHLSTASIEGAQPCQPPPCQPHPCKPKTS